ncbi:MAG: hypothetical protein ACREST_05820 [Steroidobacteraceae bacterium]
MHFKHLRHVFALGALIGLVCAPTASVASDSKVIRFTVDVAEDFTKFTPTLVSPDDIEPRRGSFFLTEGRIFPKGTIMGDGADFDPNSEGSIGLWICRGTHLANASDIISGDAEIWVATTQNYLLPDDLRSIATEGREGTMPIVRTVVGGTGKYRGYSGEQRQELLGFNKTFGVNLRVTFILRKAAN